GLRRASGRVRDPAGRGLSQARGRARSGPGDRAALERRALAARRPDGRGGDARARRLLGDGGEAPRGGVARPGARLRGEEDARVAPPRARAPGIRPRVAARARDGGAGEAALGRAPAFLWTTRPLPGDERAVPARAVVIGRGRPRGLPRPLLPEHRRL